MRAFRLWVVAGISTMMLTSCVAARPTQVTTLWREPSVGAVRFTKILAVFADDDAALRSRVESRLAARLPNAVASHRLFSNEQLQDAQCVQAALMDGKFDGVVVMRLVSVEQRSGSTSVALTPASESLWQYLRKTPRAAFRTGGEIAITMESSVYSARDGKLLWTSRSTSFNPLSTGELIGMIVDASIDEARKQRLY